MADSLSGVFERDRKPFVHVPSLDLQTPDNLMSYVIFHYSLLNVAHSEALMNHSQITLCGVAILNLVLQIFRLLLNPFKCFSLKDYERV